jgi:2-methylcitrate dehydratase PrpD
MHESGGRGRKGRGSVESKAGAMKAQGPTSAFCAALAEQARSPLPSPVRRMAERSLLNVLGTAIAASRYPAVEIAIVAGKALGGAPTSPIPGRTERLDAYGAAIATGLAAHIDDFDDTHLATVIHPAAATMATVLALGAWCGTPGALALRAFALGCEAQLRLGRAISPWHYDAGWHITGTCGAVGAAVAGAILLDLDARRLEDAVAIAASTALGQREAFGSMTKGFHAGKAAADGILAALLAERGLRGTKDVLEAPRGFFAVMTTQTRPEALAGIGESWELLENTFKPYPCGVVAHPAIDAALDLAPHVEDLTRIEAITLTCNPLVPELMGTRQPRTGLEARFSAVHGVAVALADGHVGLPQFDDARVAAADVTRLRGLVQLNVREEVRRDEARLEIALADGRSLSKHVPHARGSLERPLSDAELFEKVRALVEPVLPGATQAIETATRALADAPSLNALVATITPRPVVVG